MKLVRVGITKNGSQTLTHEQVVVVTDCEASLQETTPPLFSQSKLGEPVLIPPGQAVRLRAKNNQLLSSGAANLNSHNWFAFSPLSQKVAVRLEASGLSRSFWGRLLIGASNNSVKVILECNLDDYVKGVLPAEMPGSYELEALKAQALAARTYALHPRVDHSKDFCNVCDSYLCCQCFSSNTGTGTERQRQAVDDTACEVLTYDNAPILALFSSCAGGHTEDYANCFSDVNTNAFPGSPIPYLKGQAEGVLPNATGSEDLLVRLWNETKPDTVDAWSNHFKWHCTMPIAALEAHMHHNVELMLADPDEAPFIVPPPKAIFGDIKSFSVDRRGVAGTAMTMSVQTSKGNWQFSKELVIRNVFKNPELGIKRLNSGRLFFAHHQDSQGKLENLEIFGMGLGHGVGMQQTGAQGWARRRLGYRAILSHYYPGCQISKM